MRTFALLLSLALTAALALPGCSKRIDCPPPTKCAECPEPKPCPQCPRCPKVAPAAPMGLPQFVLDALNGPHVDRAKLYFDKTGRLTKTTAYVRKDAMPKWALEAADKELGAGEDKDFEVEQYADGTQAWEITRTVKGQLVELSLDAKTKAVRYKETKGLKLDKAPAEVAKAAAAAVEGLKLTEYATKDQGGTVTHEVYGEKDGKKWALVFAADGKELEKREFIATTMRMAR